MVRTASELFGLAWKHHQAGDYGQAEQLYRQVLQLNPSDADAWCFLGAVCQALGKIADAEGYYRRAALLMPCHSSAQNCLGILLAQQGRLDAAGGCFEQLLICDPKDADAHNNLGLVREQQGRHAEAVTSFRRALANRPDFPTARDNLDKAMRRRQAQLDTPANGCADVETVRAETAKAACREGIALFNQGRFAEARKCFEQAVHFRPDDANAHINLGNLLVHQRQFTAALAHYQEGVRLMPTNEEAHYNLGIAFCNLGRRDEAKAAYQEAVRIKPDHLDGLNNLGNLLKEQGHLNAALDCYEQGLRTLPGHAGTHLNRALVWLLKADWKRGWPEYEWRWQTDEFPCPGFRQPRWDGTPVAGRTILVFAEQGLGDTLQFIRYAPLIRQRCGRLVVQCQNPLLKILAGVRGIDQLVPRSSPLPAFDYQIPLLSVPGVLHTAFDNVPASIPYLQADPKLVEQWRRELAPLGGFKVGIAWQGSPTFRDDKMRSIALSQFERLAQVKNVRLISLQKGPGSEQLRNLAGRFPVHDLSNRLDTTAGAFMDTAAIIKNLDLVISSDTAVPHLAGALGVPAWVALPLCPDWRWQLQRADTPWYPAMRLFRQAQLGDWDNVFTRIAEELKTLLANGQNG